MASIRKRVRMLIFATGLGAALSICLSIISISELFFKEYIWIYLWFILPATLILSIISMQKYKIFRIAEVIVENQIFHIQSAYILAADKDKKTSSVNGGIDIFISNFGILLDSKVIKFNQGGIQLKVVEIEQNFISLTYGTIGRMQTIRILHAEIDNEKLKKIVEKFHFEIGIAPKIIL